MILLRPAAKRKATKLTLPAALTPGSSTYPVWNHNEAIPVDARSPVAGQPTAPGNVTFAGNFPARLGERHL